jgi:hypothetical protein
MKTYAEGYSEGYRFATKRADTFGAFLLGVFVGMVI